MNQIGSCRKMVFLGGGVGVPISVMLNLFQHLTFQRR